MQPKSHEIIPLRSEMFKNIYICCQNLVPNFGIFGLYFAGEYSFQTIYKTLELQYLSIKYNYYLLNSYLRKYLV